MNFSKFKLALLGLLVLGFCREGMAAEQSPIDVWRDKILKTRLQAEGDVPPAFEMASRLSEAMPHEATSGDQVRALNLLARTEAYMARTADAERHARQALILATEEGDRTGQAEAELNLVITSVNTAQIEAMLAAATHSVELLKGVDRPDLMGEALLRMSMMYHRYGMLQESLEVAMQSMDIARSSSDPRTLMYAYQGLAFAYRAGGHYKEASEHYAHMREQANLAGSKLLEAEAMLGLASERARLGELRVAEQQAREALVLAGATGSPFSRNAGLYTLADLLRQQKHYVAAQNLLDEMLELNERYPNPLAQWYALGARSVNFQALGNMAAAQVDAKRAYTLAERMGIPLYLSESTKRVAAISAVNGDTAQAYTLLLRANELTARADRDKLSKQTIELAGRYKAESQQREIDELTRRNRDQDIKQRWFWIAAGAASITLAGLAYFLLRLRSSKQEIDMLNASLELRVHERTAELRQQTRYMRTLFDMLPIWVWLKDTDGRYLSANQPMADAYSQSLAAMIGQTDHDLRSHALADLVRADEMEVMASRQLKIVDREELLPGAIENTWMQTYHAPVLDDDGTVLGTVGVARDISDIRRSLRLGVSRERVFEKLAQGGEIDEVLGQVASYIGVADPSVRCLITRAEVTDYSLEIAGDKNGDWIEPIRNSAGGVVGHIAISGLKSDSPSVELQELIAIAIHLSAMAIERKRIEEQLQHQAAYDALTGLPNRRMFADRLIEEIARAGRSGATVAVMFIDLDHFKEVNDTLGHHIGDALLVEVGQRIRQLVRESDVVARLGGDEFVVILPDCGNGDQLRRIGQSILDAVGQPLKLDDHTVYVSASIGIANYPEDADSMDQLIIYADRAMYAAKEEGRNGYRFFSLPMHQQAKSRLLLTNDLRLALRDNQLEVWLQSIVDLASGQATKAEALLRWRHPVHGLVSPDVFIPIAEEAGMIMEIGDWVFRQAATSAKHWLALRGGTPCQVSVNVSPRQFEHDGMIERWVGILQEIDLPAHCMVVEITEGLLLSDRVGIVDTLARLRQVGIELALDDFGTGYSAMAYLKKFNIDYLKIDRSFVRDLDTNPNDRAIAEAIIVMARKLGLKTIAEGVETSAQGKLLASVGCDLVQGYLYAKPKPAAEFFAAQEARQFMTPARPGVAHG